MSKETKFTKGNLIIDGDENTCFFNILEDEGDGHFFMVAENVTYLADAKLFKTATKLYDALESVIGEMNMLIDEVNDQRSGKITNQTESQPDYRAWCWLLGVPDGLNHYYDLCQLAETGASDDYEVFHWMTEEIFPEMAAEAKKVMSEKQYNQEFRAAFETASGRIYEEFSNLNSTTESILPHEQLCWSHDQQTLHEIQLLLAEARGEL